MPRKKGGKEAYSKVMIPNPFNIKPTHPDKNNISNEIKIEKSYGNENFYDEKEINDSEVISYSYIINDDNNEFTITKMHFFDYSVSETQIQEKFDFFDYDEQNPWKYNFINYHHNFEKDEEAKFATVILYKESMEISNKYFFETNTRCDESAYYRVTEAYRNSRR